MRLKLKHIRQHENLELDLPDSGLMNLSGLSGSGKTTIFDAIEEALFGTVSDIISWGASKCSIELELFNPHRITIVRTRGPITLTITLANGECFKDDEAQEIINNLLGMRSPEFMASSYIKQKAENSLLSFTPSEQLRFIESLGNSGFDPEMMKKSISVALSKYSSNIATLETEVIEVEKSKISLAQDIQNLQRGAELPAAPEIDIGGVNKQMAVVESKLSSIKQQNVKLNQNLASSPLKRVNALVGKKETLQQQLVTLESEHAELLTRQEILRTSDDCDVEQIQKKIKAIEEKVSILKTYKQIQELAAQVRERYPNSPAQNLLIYLQDLIKTSLVDQENISAEINEFKNQQAELLRLDEPQACPKCSTKLMILNNKILSADHVPSNLLELRTKIKESLVTLAQQLVADKRNVAWCQDMVSRADLLKKSIPTTDPAPEIKDIQVANDLIRSLGEQISVFRSTQVELEHIQSSIDRIDSKKIDTMDNIVNINTEIDKLGNPSVDFDKNLIIQIDENNKKINELEENIKVLRQSADTWNKYAAMSAQAQKTLLVVGKMKEKYNILNNRSAELQSSMSTVHEKLVATNRIKQLSDYAAVAAIESVISELNSRAAKYLDQMFNGETFIVLTHLSHTQKGEERAKIGVEVYHKGKIAKKVSNLSGGEQSRAYLAFQLGLAEMYNSPILMIDEGLTGIEDELKTQCLSILKSVADDKLVMVIEHGASDSLFDKTVEIGG